MVAMKGMQMTDEPVHLDVHEVLAMISSAFDTLARYRVVGTEDDRAFLQCGDCVGDKGRLRKWWPAYESPSLGELCAVAHGHIRLVHMVELSHEERNGGTT
jgi:hypothetical protein